MRLIVLLLYHTLPFLPLPAIAVIHPLDLHSKSIPTPFIGLLFAFYGLSLLLNSSCPQILRSNLSLKSLLIWLVVGYSCFGLLMGLSLSTSSDIFKLLLSIVAMIAFGFFNSYNKPSNFLKHNRSEISLKYLAYSRCVGYLLAPLITMLFILLNKAALYFFFTLFSLLSLFSLKCLDIKDHSEWPELRSKFKLSRRILCSSCQSFLSLVSCFMLHLSFSFFLPSFAIYHAQTYNSGIKAIALYYGLFVWVFALNPLFSKLFDQFLSSKLMIIISLFSSALGIFLMAPPTYLITHYGQNISLAGLLISALSIGAGLSFVKIDIKEIIAPYCKDSFETQIVTQIHQSTIEGLSYAVGPLISSIVTHYFNFKSSCQLVGGVLIIYGLIYCILQCVCSSRSFHDATDFDEDVGSLLKGNPNLNESLDKYSVRAFRESAPSTVR